MVVANICFLNCFLMFTLKNRGNFPNLTSIFFRWVETSNYTIGKWLVNGLSSIYRWDIFGVQPIDPNL